jgi:hypothetical protein
MSRMTNNETGFSVLVTLEGGNAVVSMQDLKSGKFLSVRWVFPLDRVSEAYDLAGLLVRHESREAGDL